MSRLCERVTETTLQPIKINSNLKGKDTDGSGKDHLASTFSLFNGKVYKIYQSTYIYGLQDLCLNQIK